jgi:hypothetical protein
MRAAGEVEWRTEGGMDMNEFEFPTVPYTDVPPLPPDTPFATEWGVLREAMPRLLAEGHDGHAAIVRGKSIVGVYENRTDALLDAMRRFPDGQYIVPYIESRIRVIKLGRAARWPK